MQYPSEIENTVSTLRMRYGHQRPYIYLAAVSFVMVIFVSLPIVSVDVSSQSPGIIRAKTDNTDVSPIVSGRVVRTNIINNRAVKRGDTLLVIDNSANTRQVVEQQHILRDIEQRIHDLLLLCQGEMDGLQTSLYRQEWTEFKQKERGLYEESREKERDFKRTQQGYRDGLVAKKDYDQAHDAMLASHRNITALRQQQVSAWQKDLQQLEEQQRNLAGELHHTGQQQHDYTIVAPIDGTLVCERAVSVGSYVVAGQSIASVSPDDSLVVECYVSPSDIGYIRTGQEVALQYTAFNYNQWGLGYAVVSEINRNVTIQENQPFFIVHCKMKEYSLRLKNGYESTIKKGMTLTGRFYITRRTLWQLLWDKVDDWLNPKQQNNR